jgi:hypothetical protein
MVHLQNDLPILVDLEAMPGPQDRIVRCTNVRTADGKRPSFVHEKSSTFLLPLAMIRLIEVPQVSDSYAVATQDNDEFHAPLAVVELPPLENDDEEAEEDLLARIREI